MTTTAWTCACGQPYRVEVLADGVRFWPRIGFGRVSIDGYCRRGLPEGTHCIGCESPLALTGAADVDAPLTRELHSTLSA
ncbi:MAG TPA: hypothetical protein VHP82_04080 [Gaiellaceae bacterium]|nr:hypothetical protein [Gaiellaceae bacterium]